MGINRPVAVVTGLRLSDDGTVMGSQRNTDELIGLESAQLELMVVCHRLKNVIILKR